MDSLSQGWHVAIEFARGLNFEEQNRRFFGFCFRVCDHIVGSREQDIYLYIRRFVLYTVVLKYIGTLEKASLG